MPKGSLEVFSWNGSRVYMDVFLMDHPLSAHIEQDKYSIIKHSMWLGTYMLFLSEEI